MESRSFIDEVFDLSQRKALVTGAGRGIGRVLALCLAKAGCDVAVLGLHIENVMTLSEEIRQLGRNSVAVQADVAVKEQVDRAFAKSVDALGGLDICVNNAGIALHHPSETLAEADWDRLMDVNLKGVFLCCQAAARYMLPLKRGSIINVASMSGSIANIPQQQAAYNASKAGVIMLSKSLAVEWAEAGIRVNSLSPGYIRTEMALETSPQLVEEWVPLIPMKRLAQVEELQGAAIYLASDASSYMTGSDLIVDGGYTAR